MLFRSEAIERSVAGLERKSRVLNEKERKIVAYHEAGHALVGEVLPEANPVQKISIVSRGVAALGYTLNMPLEDRYLMTREELEDTLAAILGGRAAEEIVFGEISTGASNDLQQATNMAERMVKEYGMSERLGLVAHREDRGQQQFLGGGAADRAYSEDTARAIDEEISRIIRQGYQRAKEVLEAQRDSLEKVVQILFEKEVMDGDELRQVLREAGVELNEAKSVSPLDREKAKQPEAPLPQNGSAEQPSSENLSSDT